MFQIRIQEGKNDAQTEVLDDLFGGAGGFSCRLKALPGGLSVKNIAFFVKIFEFWLSKIRIRIYQKTWIQIPIRIQCMIRNTVGVSKSLKNVSVDSNLSCSSAQIAFDLDYLRDQMTITEVIAGASEYKTASFRPAYLFVPHLTTKSYKELQQN